MMRMILAAALFAAGCGSISEKVGPKDQAVDDLNNQRYDDAITLLESLHQQSPDDAEIKVLLASAYTGSVGFDVIDAFDAFAPVLFQGVQKPGSSGLVDDTDTSAPTPTPTPAPTAAPTTPTTPTGESAPVNDLEKSSVKLLTQLTVNFKTLANVPFTPLKDRRRLVQALMLLDSVTDANDKNYLRAKTYAALLNALQFLNYTRDAFAAAINKPDMTVVDVICNLQVQTFLQNLDTSTGYLLSSVEDLKINYKAHDRKMPSELSALTDAAQHAQAVYEQNKDRFNDADLAFTATKKSYCGQ